MEKLVHRCIPELVATKEEFEELEERWKDEEPGHLYLTMIRSIRASHDLDERGRCRQCLMEIPYLTWQKEIRCYARELVDGEMRDKNFQRELNE